MNSITALMLSQAIEADHRREIERRRHRFIKPEPMDHERRARSWRLRLPRFSLVNSKA